jgi:glycosyltransferase involved in cell wall biosynthesis
MAAEGLDVTGGRHLLIGENDAQLAGAVERILDDPGLASRLAEQGRSFVEGRHTWDVALSRLEGWLANLAALPKRNALLRMPGRSASAEAA